MDDHSAFILLIMYDHRGPLMSRSVTLSETVFEYKNISIFEYKNKKNIKNKENIRIKNIE